MGLWIWDFELRLLVTERARDPAKVDDATLCQIAALAAEHG